MQTTVRFSLFLVHGGFRDLGNKKQLRDFENSANYCSIDFDGIIGVWRESVIGIFISSYSKETFMRRSENKLVRVDF